MPVRNVPTPEERTKRVVKDQLEHLFHIATRFPGCPVQDGTLNELIPKLKISTRYGYEKPQIRTARAHDGLVITFKKPEFLYDGFYDLLWQDKAEPIYAFKPGNINSQMMPPERATAFGVEAIAAQPRIIETLSYCAGMLAVEASYGWQNAYRPGSQQV